MSDNIKIKLAWVILLTVFFITFPLAKNRLNFEQENIRVEIISEKDDPRLMTRIIEEYTLEEWNEKNWLNRWKPGMQGPVSEFTGRKKTEELLIFSDKSKFEQAYEVFKLKFKLNDVQIKKFREENFYYILLNGLPWDKLKDIGMGPESMAYNPQNRYYIRPVNGNYITPAYINWLFETLKYDGVIFKGKEVAGYPDNLLTLISILKQKNLPVYTIEGTAQKGFEKIAGSGVNKGVKVARLHSIPEHITEKKELLGRIRRAVRERNIRGIYLKTQKHNIFIPEIRKTINNAGLAIGHPVFYNILENRQKRRRFIGGILSIAGILLWFKINIFIVFFMSVFTLVFSLIYPTLGLNFIILFLGIAFPLKAFQYALKDKTKFLPAIIYAFFLALAGGYLVGIIGFDPVYFLKIEPVRGIKLALFLPVFLAFFTAYKDSPGFLKKHITRFEILLITFLGAVLSLYILRSSNAMPGLVTDWEINLRQFLENTFTYRPRFKEFLWGHPLFIAGIYFLKQKRNFKLSEVNFGKLIVILGIIGLVSVINSFMHFHTPLFGSVIRSLWGFLLGFLISLVPIIFIKIWT
ncbi:MAG: DUF5693 family protein [Elusimicrobiota bacterium]